MMCSGAGQTKGNGPYSMQIHGQLRQVKALGGSITQFRHTAGRLPVLVNNGWNVIRVIADRCGIQNQLYQQGRNFSPHAP